MKTLTKPKKRALRPCRVVNGPARTPALTAGEFRRRLHVELADEIRVAQESFRKTHGHLLRPRTPVEAKANGAAARAMFARWEKEDRRDPPPYDDWEEFKALLEANRMRSAPLFAE